MISEEVLIGLLTKPVPATKNNINATCPYCGKEDHFFINKITLLNDCKKCGKQGNEFTFLQVLGKLHLRAGKQVKHDKLSFLSANQLIIEPVTIEVPDIKMPIGSRLLSYTAKDKYVDYLKSRKLKKIDFDLYSPSYTMLKEKYYNYVLLQVQRDFMLKGFIARYIGTKEDKNRYLNSESDFSKLLFGYDELDSRTTTAILTEGIFDKTSVTTELGLHYDNDMKCLCTFGKKVSDVHIMLLKKTGVKNIILMHDGRDAVNDIKKSAFKLKKEGFSVWAAYTKDKDPGECNGSELFDVMSKIETAESFWLSKLHKRKIK